MELKDVLHYYLGCECKFGVFVPGQETIFYGQRVDTRVIHNVLNNLGDVKPILRRLSSMTEEEAIMLCSLNLPKGWQPGHIIKTNDEDIAAMRIFDMKGDYKTLYIPKNRISPSNFVWLLKHGFDLFWLIDSNQAIDRDNQ